MILAVWFGCFIGSAIVAFKFVQAGFPGWGIAFAIMAALAEITILGRK